MIRREHKASRSGVRHYTRHDFLYPRLAGAYEGWDNDPHAQLGEPWAENATCRQHEPLGARPVSHHEQNVRGVGEWNEVSNPLLERAGIPLLRIYRPSRARWMDHTGRRPHDTYRRRSILDCAHYCLPSAVLDYWTRAMMERIIGLRDVQ